MNRGDHSGGGPPWKQLGELLPRPQCSWQGVGGGGPWAKVPKEPTAAPQWEARLKAAKLW